MSRKVSVQIFEVDLNGKFLGCEIHTVNGDKTQVMSLAAGSTDLPVQGKIPVQPKEIMGERFHYPSGNVQWAVGNEPVTAPPETPAKKKAREKAAFSKEVEAAKDKE